MVNTHELNAESEAAKRSPRKANTESFFTPCQLASRWGWHPESVRRAIRQRRIEVVIIPGGRLLVPTAEVQRIEREGTLARAI